VESTSKSRQLQGVDLREWGVVALILVVAALLRGYGLTAGGLNLDEGYSLIQSERSLFEIFALNRFDANPPLYIVILHSWRAAMPGDLELVGKSLAMAAGVLGVFGVWLAARERFGSTAGAAASLIVALNAFHVHHSQEIRGYSLLFAAVALADYFFVRWDHRHERRALLMWSIASWFAVNIHHFAWYFVALHAVSVMVWRGEAARRKPVIVALGCIVLASTPMLAAFVIHLTVYQSQSWIPLQPFENLVVILGAIGGRPPVAWVVWCLALLGVMGCALASRSLRVVEFFLKPPLPNGRVRCFVVPLLQLLLPALLWVGSYALFPMLLSRYCLIAVLPLAVLAGGGVACLRSRPLSAIVAIAFLGLSRAPLELLYGNEQKLAYLQNWAEIVRTEYREGDVVLYTDKHMFVPSIALHPAEMDEYLLPELVGRNRSTVLAHYTDREVRRPPLEPGEYERLWLVKRKGESMASVLRDKWLARVSPQLIRVVPDSEIYLFRLHGRVR
jgi:uncharacterized membrane protein